MSLKCIWDGLHHNDKKSYVVSDWKQLGVPKVCDIKWSKELNQYFIDPYINAKISFTDLEEIVGFIKEIMRKEK